jgi:DedD protein
MASNGRKGGGDFVLESRHLVGLFFGLVVIFAVVFTLGYLLGRTQYDAKLRAAMIAETPVPAHATPANSNPEFIGTEKKDVGEQVSPTAKPNWDFYHAGDARKPEDKLQPVTAKPVATPAEPAKLSPASETSISRPVSGLYHSAVPKGAIMLQIAAVQTEKDALSLAHALQQKKIPAFVMAPGADKYYRVQLGPYTDAKTAAAARHDLEAKGFKPITKR